MILPHVASIRRSLALATVVMLLPAAGLRANLAETSPGTVDPFALYGPVIEFDVFRDGDEVGFHRVRFLRDGDDVIADATFDLRIDVLSVTVFRYLYRSQGRWRDGELAGLNVNVDDDGQRSAVTAKRQGRQMEVVAKGGTTTAAAPLYPTNHWNPRVLTQDRVLNTLTGRVNTVQIKAQDRTTVATERGAVPATRYAFSGELETDVWYDDAGRWVKMRFRGQDGSLIEYVCRRCQGPTGGSANP